MKITVLGDGGWGTTLAILLKNKGFDVSLWGAFKSDIEAIKKDGENRKFLPGFKIPKTVSVTDDMFSACEYANLITLAIPSRFMRGIITKNSKILKESRAGFVSCAKGIEEKSLKRMSEVVREALGDVEIAVLSGPSIAPEVARGIPTAVTVASEDEIFARKASDIFRTERFRVYTNKDLIGVEFGGALKNIIAIASGISDGLGFGANTKAAILTRGLAEMTRLGTAMGASRETFQGLSGLGDLITTCVSSEGRNHRFGEEIGKGKKPELLLSKSVTEIEGAWTSRAAIELGKIHKIELPITQQVYSVLFENKPPLSAVNELMTREPKAE
ncbi:MAG: NAD(P)H-dependent glycerol-3-phosphate dehydrogenase [Candidatus Omnitrophota bacterium]|nr:NAD(P)H-dependent glycerol-3-phosphate dehydrogenase [Candidatus Omnitrophota bacterium]